MTSASQRATAHAAALNSYRVQTARAYKAGHSMWISSRALDTLTTATLLSLTAALKLKLDQEAEKTQ